MEKFKLLLLILMAAVICQVSAAGFPFSPDKTVKIDRFLGMCPGYQNLDLYFKDAHFIVVRRICYITGKLVAKRRASDKMWLLLELQRCRSKEALDSCEPYPNINIRNICELTGATFQPWTPFINTLEPPFSCPVNPGTYSTTNGTFDGSALLVLPVEGWYWKIHAKVYETVNKADKLIMCVYVEGQVVNV